MSDKLYSNAVVLDGKLDEAVWESAAENTGFVRIATAGGGLADVQTSFKVYSADECVYFGVKCYEPDMASVIAGHPFHDLWGCDAIELFLSPSGKSFDFYQFVVTFGGKQVANYHSEGGNIKPDPYRPFWKCAVHADKDFWSLEAAIPLTAFYMTEPDDWSSEWLVNVTRTRTAVPSKMFRSTWSKLDTSYLEPNNFRKLGGFPMRKPEDAVRIVSADVELTSAVDDGYTGVMSVKTLNPVAEKFVFATKYTEPYETQLKVGYNDFTLPCRFDETGRISVAMSLCRESDGKMFERYYPIKVNYEPLKVRMVLPEYRCNFYPGQDYSRVEGYVEVGAGKEAVVTLAGPGIGTLTAVPESDGHFVFDTSGLEIGTAVLTASIPEYKVEKKIRRLDKTGHRMAWISGGNLIVDGEPVLRRNMYAEYYRGGEAFKRRYDADDDYCMTMEITSNPLGSVEPSRLIKGIENIEAQKDVVPCDELFKLVEETIERNKDRDFVYYYINDEPECRGLSPIYLKHLYDFIAEKDPYHVVLMASRGASKFIDCADWFETHPYINPCTHADGSRTYSRNINTLGSFIDDVIKLGRSDKCIGLIPTCFSYKFTSRTEFGPDYPNFREMVCHIWAAMIRGGKTLWPYAYHDLNDRASLYEGTRYIFKSFAALDKLVLLGKRTTLVQTPDYEAVKYELDDESMFVLVNLSQAEHTVTLDGIDGKWFEFRGEREFTGKTFTLVPQEVIIGTSVRKDAGLPTYAETDVLINKLEAERVGRGNKLFDRWLDVEITSSKGGTMYKLFDGITDNLAWFQSGSDKFMQIKFRDIHPEFTKLNVCGAHLEDMKLMLCFDGEWREVTDAVKTESEYSTLYTFDSSVSCDGFRVEFARDYVELYEFEVL